MPRAKAPSAPLPEDRPALDVADLLESVAGRATSYPKGQTVLSRGQASDAVGPGDFFGEGALTGQSIRLRTATATMSTTVVIVEKAAMLRLLRDQATFSQRFIAYMLARNLRIEADLGGMPAGHRPSRDRCPRAAPAIGMFPSEQARVLICSLMGV